MVQSDVVVWRGAWAVGSSVHCHYSTVRFPIVPGYVSRYSRRGTECRTQMVQQIRRLQSGYHSCNQPWDCWSIGVSAASIVRAAGDSSIASDAHTKDAGTIQSRSLSLRYTDYYQQLNTMHLP